MYIASVTHLIEIRCVASIRLFVAFECAIWICSDEVVCWLPAENHTQHMSAFSSLAHTELPVHERLDKILNETKR